MSNPFDQFATDFQAALPPGAPGLQPDPSSAPPPYGAAPQQHIMNTPAPPPQQQQQPQGYVGADQPQFGQPQPAYGQTPFAAAPPPSSQPPPVPTTAPPPPPTGSDNPFSSFGQAAPAEQPPPPPTADATAGNPFASMPTQGPGGPVATDPAAPTPFGMVPDDPPPSQPGADPWGSSDQGQPQPPQAPAPIAEQVAPPQPGAPPPPQPYGAPPAQPQPYGALPPSQPTDFGAVPTPQQPPLTDPSGALVVSQQQSNPYAQQAPNPYGQPPAPGPYGQPAYGQPYQQQPPPPQPAPVDPFSVFEASTPAPATEPAPFGATSAPPVAAAPQEPNAVSDDEFWGSLAPKADESAPPPASTAEENETASEEKKGDEGLPPGGEYYDARIFTPTLGVMFFKPQELTDSLFLNTDRNTVDTLAERPVVAFIVEGSSARSAGVELGHVLLKVNGKDVKNPKEASRLIKEGPRPLPLLFYVPNTDVVVAEGEHMVKYDTRETTAPNSAKDWKPKYVVIGGIIAQPWMMNMYRSKSEYDIAVIETQARRPVSVKVKQFSLQGARIQNDWQGPQMVKYKNKLHPWKYIVVLPVARNPIKISSPNLAQLKPVHEGIRRVLLAQQRSRGPANNTAAPVRDRDPYAANRSSGGGNQYAGGGGGHAAPPPAAAYGGQQQGGYVQHQQPQQQAYRQQQYGY